MAPPVEGATKHSGKRSLSSILAHPFLNPFRILLRALPMNVGPEVSDAKGAREQPVLQPTGPTSKGYAELLFYSWSLSIAASPASRVDSWGSMFSLCCLAT